MDTVTYCRAMEALCRQQAILDSEREQFWLNEANIWAIQLSNLEMQQGAR
jgi:hypothetical protein